MKRPIQLLFIGLIFVGCTSNPPLREYTLARTALDSARRIEAVRVAPAFFHKAEESYRKAELQFKKEQFDEAKDQFVMARDYAEKAENAARVQKPEGDK